MFLFLFLLIQTLSGCGLLADSTGGRRPTTIRTSAETEALPRETLTLRRSEKTGGSTVRPADEAVPAVTLFPDPDHAGYRALDDAAEEITRLEIREPGNVSVRFIVHHEDVDVCLESLNYYEGMDTYLPSFELFRISRPAVGSIYEFEAQLAAGQISQRLKVVQPDGRVKLFPLKMNEKEASDTVELFTSEPEVMPLTVDSPFVWYCGALGLSAFLYQEAEESDALFYREPYYYWLPLVLGLTHTNPHNYADSYGEDDWPIEEWLLEEHRAALLSMVPETPDPPELLARYVPERSERYDLKPIYERAIVEEFEVRSVEEIAPGRWNVFVKVQNNEIERGYVVQVEAQTLTAEFEPLFPYYVTSIHEVSHDALEVR